MIKLLNPQKLILTQLILMLMGMPYPAAASTRLGKIETLETAVKKYWQAKLMNDFVTCYQMEDPNYKKKVPLSQYARYGKIIYTHYEIEKIDIDGYKAVVDMKIEYFLPVLGSKAKLTMELPEKWIYLNQKWYHKPNSSRRNENNTQKERR